MKMLNVKKIFIIMIKTAVEKKIGLVTMIVNRFILIIVIFSSNFLLLSKQIQDNHAPVNKGELDAPIKNLPPINITPLYAPDISDIAKPEKLPSEKRKHSQHVQEKTTFENKMVSEGKVILTFTYTGIGSEGFAFLKEQYPDFFERMEESFQKNLSTQNVANQPLIDSSSTKIPQWLLESSMDNAPVLLQGISIYLQSCKYSRNASQKVRFIPSFHRFILVGPPGTGKTTLAYAVAHMLNYPVVFIPATSLLGHFRNETSNKIEKFLQEQTVDGLPKVIIIDELHKLFEHYANNNADDSQSAAAFWLAIDKIEKYNSNVIIIGTANSVVKLPPEIKSRFSGKIITMPLLDKNQKIQTFINSIAHDQSIELDNSVNDEFIAKMLQQIQNCSLRDVQLIIDSAKIFYYSEQFTIRTEFPIVLTRTHFEQALDQLQVESQVLQENVIEKIYEKIKKWGIPLSVAVNILIFIKESNFLLQHSYGLFKIN